MLPSRYYKNKGWISSGDFLGSGNIATQLKKYRSFKKAKIFARSHFKSSVEFVKYRKSGKLPKDIPGFPSQTYKNKGWKGWGDFLGTGRIALRLRRYKPFREARKFVRNLQLKSNSEWLTYCKSGKKPSDLPSNIERVYKNKGWKGCKDFLGTG